MPNELFEYKTSGASSGPTGGALRLDEAQGIVECFVAGIGNKDSVGDIVSSGAFTKSLMRRKPRVVWGHSWNDPIGKVLEIYEVPTTDPRLPMKMKMAGIGGLFARVQFNLNSEKGKEAFANVAFFGEEQEWSIGYKTLRAQFDQKAQANVIFELELYEVSPVLHGANQLTGTISIKTDELNDAGYSFGSTVNREEMQRQLEKMYGPQVTVDDSDEETVTFSRPNQKGDKDKFKCHWSRNGSNFMFGAPSRIVAPQIPTAPISGMPSFAPNSGPSVVVARPQPMMNVPVAVKPNPIGPGTITVPLPAIEYENRNTPVDKTNLNKEESDLRDALLKIVKRHGKFDETGDGIWAGYYPPEENSVAAIGVKCSNCVMYEGGTSCKIIKLPVHPEGKCRFAVIPDGVVKGSFNDKKTAEELEEKEQDDFMAEFETKYPGEFILGVLRNTVKKRRRRRRKLFKDLSAFDGSEIEEKEYCIPVLVEQAFEVKQMLDPILEFYNVQSFVDPQGIIVKSGITVEFIDAVDTAMFGYNEKKKIR